MRKLSPFTFAAFLLPALACAAPQSDTPSPQMQRMQQMLQQKFEAADTNHDGKLSRDEAQAGMPRVAAHFDDIDTAHSGSITLAQIEAYLSAHARQ